MHERGTDKPLTCSQESSYKGSAVLRVWGHGSQSCRVHCWPCAGKDPRQEFHLIALEFKAIADAFLSSETRPDQHCRTWMGGWVVSEQM